MVTGAIIWPPAQNNGPRRNDGLQTRIFITAWVNRSYNKLKKDVEKNSSPVTDGDFLYAGPLPIEKLSSGTHYLVQIVPFQIVQI